MARTLTRPSHCPDLGRASAPAAPPRFGFFAWHRLFARLSPWTPRIPRLDPETLPDHLRRDLGLADGRGAPPRNAWRD